MDLPSPTVWHHSNGFLLGFYVLLDLQVSILSIAICHCWHWCSVLHGQTWLSSGAEFLTLGHPASPSTSGIESGRRIFILGDVMQTEGILVELSAYFRNSNPLNLQIWRPLGSNAERLKLLQEVTITPTTVGAVDKVQLPVGLGLFTVYSWILTNPAYSDIGTTHSTCCF